MGSTPSTAKPAGGGEIIPPWVYTVKIPPECMADKIGNISDGMTIVGPNTVLRSRNGHFDTDGARWSRGFSSGQHTFEIVFPAAQRGLIATVGVGTEEAPLYAKGRVALCGNNRHSWGICLRTRRAWHRGSQVKKYPQTQAFLPDKFYMYLDVDAATLMFGSDLDFYGCALSGLPKGQLLYPMVCPSTHGATITIVYRGKGNIGDVHTVHVVGVGANQPSVTVVNSPGGVAPQPMPPHAMYPQPMQGHPMHPQPMHPQPMQGHPMHPQPMQDHPMHPQPMPHPGEYYAGGMPPPPPPNQVPPPQGMYSDPSAPPPETGKDPAGPGGSGSPPPEYSATDSSAPPPATSDEPLPEKKN